MNETSRKPWVKWLVLGCSGLLLVALVGAAGLVSLVMGGIKESGAYQGAMELARQSPLSTAALGEPLEPGFFVSGSVSVAGPSGQAELSVPLSGPKGKGTLYVEATKGAGQWEYSRLELEVEGQEQRIDLLAEE